jgi:hypothetical protein
MSSLLVSYVFRSHLSGNFRNPAGGVAAIAQKPAPILRRENAAEPSEDLIIDSLPAKVPQGVSSLMPSRLPDLGLPPLASDRRPLAGAIAVVG